MMLRSSSSFRASVYRWPPGWRWQFQAVWYRLGTLPGGSTFCASHVSCVGYKRNAAVVQMPIRSHGAARHFDRTV